VEGPLVHMCYTRGTYGGHAAGCGQPQKKCGVHSTILLGTLVLLPYFSKQIAPSTQVSYNHVVKKKHAVEGSLQCSRLGMLLNSLFIYIFQ